MAQQLASLSQNGYREVIITRQRNMIDGGSKQLCLTMGCIYVSRCTSKRACQPISFSYLMGTILFTQPPATILIRRDNTKSTLACRAPLQSCKEFPSTSGDPTLKGRTSRQSKRNDALSAAHCSTTMSLRLINYVAGCSYETCTSEFRLKCECHI